MYFENCVLLKQLSVTVVCLIAAACDTSNGNTFTETFSFGFQEQSTIIADNTSRPVSEDSSITFYIFSVEPGDDLVFLYQRNVNPPEDILYGGLNETLVFQVPADSDSFEIKEDRLIEAQAFFRRSCFCEFSGAGFRVTGGFIRGEKLSAVNWIVKADVAIEGIKQTYNVQFKDIFLIDEGPD